ncbi:DUF5691 domain-containing protein [Streptomyces sp. 8N616]|uniref:DUF5691 domain-containing protein n=1 Tax=Streptomyces sp. 8N616 TaxID=3457414 RepID=UPI003FD04E03
MTTTTQQPAASWEALVSAALLGTERRRPPVSGSAAHEREPTTALLDAAAVSTVRRRAGLRPAPARERPAVAPEDGRPPLPPAAQRRLAALLANRAAAPGNSGGRRGTAPDLTELLPQWLTAANHHGYRAPAALLPALLDAARARTDLRQDALALGGPRALWLARLNPDWRFALRGAAGGSGLPETWQPGSAQPSTAQPRSAQPSAAQPRSAQPSAAQPRSAQPSAAQPRSAQPSAAQPRSAQPRTGQPATGQPATGQPGNAESDAVQRTWQEGLFAERVALLAALRRRDPAAALALLGSTWVRERAEDRLMFVDSLRTGLSPADEPFLEQALSDRSRNVRATAAELLSALPGSALATRMAERATACVALDRTGAASVIAVEAPHACDAAMQRDGVAPKPPSGCGERAWWLGQIVESAPLSCWKDRLGGRSPAEVVALPVADNWQADLHAAWCRAAVRQQDSEWSRALLGPPGAASGAAGPSGATAATASMGERAKLLSALPPGERAAWAAEFIAAHGLSEAFQLLGVCTVPWAEPLGRAVVDALDIARDAGSYPWSFSGVMGLAERCLDPAQADRVELLTAIPDETESASPGAGGYWSEAFQRLVGTLRLRATMHRELAAPTDLEPADFDPAVDHPADLEPADLDPAVDHPDAGHGP